MRKMKTILMLTVKEENAASIFKVNPEYLGSTVLQNARNTPYFSMVSTPKISNTIIVKIKNRRVNFVPKAHLKMGVHF
jgi:hypothetical protein